MSEDAPTEATAEGDVPAETPTPDVAQAAETTPEPADQPAVEASPEAPVEDAEVTPEEKPHDLNQPLGNGINVPST
jgi:hypothetical protein